VFESALPGANVSAVARRNGLSPQQLFGWRREVRALIGEMAADATVADGGVPASARTRPLKSGSPTPLGRTANAHGVARLDGIPSQDAATWPRTDAPVFVRAVIAAPVAPPPAPADPQPSDTGPSERPEPECPQGSTIEITVGEAVVRLSGHVDAAALAVVLDALRRTS
jgi:Transposase